MVKMTARLSCGMYTLALLLGAVTLITGASAARPARELAAQPHVRSGAAFNNMTRRVFTVVIDAGSSGSRINVFEFLTNSLSTSSRLARNGQQLIDVPNR